MNSQRFLGLLEQDGYDQATREAIVSLAESKPIADARKLLIGMLGENNGHVESYLVNRQQAEANQQRALASQIPFKTMKSKKPKPLQTDSSSSQTSQTNSEKVDSVKDIDAAMKKLSVNTPGRVECDCMGSRHGLLDMAPNCLNCGKIVCKKEGLGPCLHCKEPLLPNDKVKEIVEILTKQKYAVIATMNKKALVAAGIDPSIKQDIDAMFKSNVNAEANLERLLGYQENDSVRTRIIDQVGEVDLPSQGLNQWATASEQAEQLRLQQKALRRAEAERKMRMGQGKKVLSIDVRGNKIYQSVVDAPIEEQIEDEDEDEDEESVSKEPQDLLDIEPELTKPVHYFDSKATGKYKAPRYDPKQAPESASQNSRTEGQNLAEVTIRRDADEGLLY